MNWVLIFVSFFGPLYDSSGFITEIRSEESLSYNTEISCNYSSSLINGRLKSMYAFKNNSGSLKKKATICVSFKDWSNYKEVNNTKVFDKNNLQTLFKNFELSNFYWQYAIIAYYSLGYARNA